MISMRAMQLENEIEAEFTRFAKLRAQLEKLVPAGLNTEDAAAWVSGEKDEDGWRVGDVDEVEQIEDVRALLSGMIHSTYKLEGYLHTRATLMS